MRIKALLYTLLLAMLARSVFLTQRAEAQVPAIADTTPAYASSYDALPMAFEANQGQSAGPVKFLSRGQGYTAFLTAEGMVLSLHPASVPAQAEAGGSVSVTNAKNITLQFKLIGAAANPTAAGENPLPGKVNYFIGNDRTKWHTNIAAYARVRYRNVYPGVDLVYYGNHSQLEYDFAVSPGADASKIKFEIAGADNIRLDGSGNLVLSTANGELHFQKPQVYQESNGERIPVQGDYVMEDSTHVGFKLSAADPSQPTVIDPVLLYATYLGGSGQSQAESIAVDASGNVYVAGYTDSTDFPLTALGTLSAGSQHAFVAKLNASGSALVYADYLGGNGDDNAYALTLDSSNEVYVAGTTASSNFPTLNAYQSTSGGPSNAFVTKISADGSSLMYSTYFGGNGFDVPTSIAVDGSSDILLAGNTTSTNFPVANAYQPTAAANQGGLFGTYGFLSKFNPAGSELIYSTYFAGNTNVSYPCGTSSCWSAPFSAVAGMAIDSGGNAYVAGSTNTYNFPTTSGVYETSTSAPQNNLAGFLGKFNASGGLTYSTYFDESSGALTTINALAVDASGDAYVTGTADSDGTFRITNPQICDPSSVGTACQYAFVTELDPAGATLLYSTFLGANNGATPAAISLDATNDAYIVAYTPSSTFQIVNGIENVSTEGDQYLPANNDLLVIEVSPNGAAELFATYLGGSGNDTAGSIALDASGNLYIAGTTNSSDFPVTQGSYQEALSGNTDGFIAKIGAGSEAAISLAPFSLQFASEPVGAAGPSQAVLLRNMGSAGVAIASINGTGDFAQTNDCGGTIPAAGTCKFVVTFTPSAVGSRSGSISIADSAPGSPHVINLSGTGLGPLVTLFPLSLQFGATASGTASAEQTLTLTNSGNTQLDINAISDSGDFSQSNGCGASLAAGANCQIEVTFTPSTAGIRSGTLTVTDNAGGGGSQSIVLTGTGIIPGAAVIGMVPSQLAFLPQSLGSSSASQLVTVTNHGGTATSISSISITGNFTQTSNCNTLAANGGTCSIAVTFTPSASGSRTGTLTIANSGASLQSISLTGAGVDFALATSTSTDTIQSGGSASYSLSVTPVGGSFPNAIQLSCTGLPQGAACAFSQTDLTPGLHTVTATLSISTTASIAQNYLPHSVKGFGAFWIPFQAFGLFGMVFAGCTKRSKKVVLAALLVLVFAGLVFMPACAGGTGTSSQTQTQTTSKSYSILVNGTSGNLQHSVPLTLTVQQN
jgi:hypothetical protein